MSIPRHWRLIVGGAVVFAALTPPGRRAVDQGTEILKSINAKWNQPPAALVQFFNDAERAFGIPTGLLTRVGYQECRWRADIISGQTKSSAGAVGVMQFMPATAAGLGINPLNPAEAIPGAARYLSGLKKQFGDWEKSCAAYNWGGGNLTKLLAKNPVNWKAGLPTETANYIGEIFADLIKAQLAGPKAIA